MSFGFDLPSTVSPESKAVGGRVKEIRELRHLSSDYVAHTANMDPSNFRKKEKGTIGLDDIGPVSKALGVSKRTLLKAAEEKGYTGDKMKDVAIDMIVDRLAKLDADKFWDACTAMQSTLSLAEGKKD